MTTIRAATHTTRVTTSTDIHDGYTTWFETTTTNPYFTKTLMRYLGAERPEAERHTGIGTPAQGPNVSTQLEVEAGVEAGVEAAHIRDCLVDAGA